MTVALLFPVLVGLNATPNEQVWFAGSTAGHVLFTSWKLVALLPPRLMPRIPSWTAPFVTVTVCVADVAPTVTLPNDRVLFGASTVPEALFKV